MAHSFAQFPSLQCPRCGAAFSPDIWLIIDAAERPLLCLLRGGVAEPIAVEAALERGALRYDYLSNYDDKVVNRAGHRRLGRPLLGPLLPHLDGIEHLVIAPEGSIINCRCTPFGSARPIPTNPGRRCSTGPNNAMTTMTYDKLGRKLTMNDPDMGFWSYGYDGSGNLARQTDAKNQRLCFYYDAANRPTSKRHDGTGTTPCPAMWGGTLLANYTYHTSGAGKGMPASTTGGSGAGAFADTFTYDFRGRVTSYARVINGVSFNLSTTYDAADRVETLTYGNSDGNEVVTYTYDGEFPETLHSQKKGGNLVADLTHNFRGQLTGIDRVGNGIEDTALTYHDQNENFQLRRLNHGATNDDIPDFHYEDYDALTQLREMNTLYSTGTAVSTFTYDGVGRMLTEQRSGDPSGVNYNYTYTYGAGGNIDKRKSETSGVVRNYVYDIDDTPNDGRHYHALESVTGDGLTATFINDPNGNMSSRTMNGVTYTQAFDVENRLTSVTVNGQVTSFHYDAGGNRTLTVQPNGTKVYTPFPEYEKTVPVTGTSTERNHYLLSGQLIAARVKVAGQTGAFYYFYTDRRGSVYALRKADGTWVNGNYARYDAYGGYRTTPATTVNPGISDRGFTGHRMNNTGSYGFGLIYMNARYYLPEIGRFISPDSIVPDPQNPQSYNRYSYTRNNPVNFTDPTGHRECEIICDGESQNWRTYQDSAWLEGWDVKQQAANSATAETVLVDVPQAIVGAFWEPADWVLALRDGFHWNDSFGMLPFVPATVG